MLGMLRNFSNRDNCRIIEKNNGKAPLTYHQFQAIISSMDPPPQAEATITQEVIGTARTPVQDDHDDRYGVPTLDELGFDTEGLKPPVWIGGETEALGKYLLKKRLDKLPLTFNFQLVWNVTWKGRLGWPRLVVPKCHRSPCSQVKPACRPTSDSGACQLVFSTIS